MSDAVVENPVFAVLSDEPRFKSLAEKLINNNDPKETVELIERVLKGR